VIVIDAVADANKAFEMSRRRMVNVSSCDPAAV
jgi:hypothetical protein